jgi:hypothetical protein
VNLAYALGRDGFRSIDLLDTQTGFVFVEMLASQSGTFVIWPDERLAAVYVIQLVRMIDLVIRWLP